jgi:hypothetical protein
MGQSSGVAGVVVAVLPLVLPIVLPLMFVMLGGVLVGLLLTKAGPIFGSLAGQSVSVYGQATYAVMQMLRQIAPYVG